MALKNMKSNIHQKDKKQNSDVIHTLFWVKVAAQLSVGPSVKWINVALIGNEPLLGASSGINDPTADPIENPFGNADASVI